MGMNSEAKLVYGINLGTENDEDADDEINYDAMSEVLEDNKISYEFYGYDCCLGCIATVGDDSDYPQTKKECILTAEWGAIPVTLSNYPPILEDEKQELINQLKSAGIPGNFEFSWHLASLYF